MALCTLDERNKGNQRHEMALLATWRPEPVSLLLETRIYLSAPTRDWVICVLGPVSMANRPAESPRRVRGMKCPACGYRSHALAPIQRPLV